ncbi:hypothetical protein WR25_04943 isoform B [Diploscapter pachys]|uniref:Telomere length regulation protein conserved domain-containing protein n=2 Tax=Diploscapter pachys TaxID=2018661 RepID=A0A2A2JQW0_9BILA|nr:hypothetical protein WR25_04943 isoform B [Diploscapter pachys]
MFQDGIVEGPSEVDFKKAMEVYGHIRMIDIPYLDPVRKFMDPKFSGVQTKGFGFGQDVFFEAYVQYAEYKGFATAMDALRNMKWVKKIDGRYFQANVKVAFDTTRHLSNAMILQRDEERRKIITEKRSKMEQEQRDKEDEERRHLETHKRAREEEHRRRERLIEKREKLKQEDEESRAAEKDAERQARARRIIESQRLVDYLFKSIQIKEDRRIKIEEAKLKESLRKVEQLEEDQKKEEMLRATLLKQRELRIRERLKEKMSSAPSNSRSPGPSSSFFEDSPYRPRSRSGSRSTTPSSKRSESKSSSASTFERVREKFTDKKRSGKGKERVKNKKHKKKKHRKHRSRSGSSSRKMSFELARRLREASDRAVILTILAEIRQTCKIEKNPSEYSAAIEAILQNEDKIGKFLTGSEITSNISPLPLNCTVSCILSMITAISSTFSSKPTQIGLDWLEQIFKNRLSDIVRDTVDVDPENENLLASFDDLVNVLVSMPDRLHNLQKARISVSIPKLLEIFEDSLKSGMIQCFSKARRTLDLENSRVNLAILQKLVAKGRHLKIQSSIFLQVCLKFLLDQNESDQIWSRISQRIFTDESIGSRMYEALATDVFLYAKGSNDLIRCFGFHILSSGVLRLVAARRLLFHRISPDSIIHSIAEYIGICGDLELYSNTFKDLLRVWASSSFIKRATPDEQKYRTKCCLIFGSKVNKFGLSQLWSEFFNILLPGVTERLNNGDIVTRQSGMFLGEMANSWWEETKEKLEEKENSLKFEFQEDEWYREMKSCIAEPTERPDLAVGDEHLEHRESQEHHLQAVQNNSVNLQKVGLEDLDSDDEFPQYEISEEERNVQTLKPDEIPEKKADSPVYLTDAMEQLNEKEKYEIFEAALFSLESLIRRKALGFEHLAENLAKKLALLENRFNTEKFEEVRLNAIIACLVMKPTVALSLEILLYSNDLAMCHRYLILTAFVQASKELNGELKSGVQINAQKIEEIAQEAVKTLKQERPTNQRANNFASVAQYFFYPLLETQPGQHLDFYGADAQFLSRILLTASEILQTARFSPSIVKMSSHLSQKIALLRFHEDHCVRLSVMLCYTAICTVLSKEVFISVFGTLCESWLEWLRTVAESAETSQSEKGLAVQLITLIVEKIRNI